MTMTGPNDSVISEAHQWRSRLADPSLSASDKRAFDEWMQADPRHVAAFADAETFWRVLGEVEYDERIDRPLLSERVRTWFGSLHRFDAAAHPLRALGGVTAVVAAGLLIALFFPGFGTVPPQPLVFETRVAEELQAIALTDGTDVQLAAGSRIEVSIEPQARTVELARGAAFFDVAPDPDRPFRVVAGGAAVRVTGTTFDVQRGIETVSVSVAEGRVVVAQTVQTAGDSAAGGSGEPAPVRVLGANQRVVLSEDGLGEVVAVDPDDVAAWRSGRLVYTRRTLAEIVDEVSRYHDRPVRVDPAVAGLRLSGRFRTDDIEGMLATLDEALPIEVVDIGPMGLLLRAEP